MGIFKNMGVNIPGGNFLGNSPGGSSISGNFPGGSFPDTSLKVVNCNPYLEDKDSWLIK